MHTSIVVAAVMMGTGVVSGCAATRHPLQIGVTDDGFSVDGQVLRTRAELTEAIRASGATECRVQAGVATAYKQVETAVLAVREADCRPGIVGSVGP